MEDLIFNLGYWGIFLASFLAATIVPFSSEAILSLMLVSGYHPVYSLLLATLGNWLGGLSSFGLGYLGKEQWLIKYFRIDAEKLHRIKHKIQKHTRWIAFFCWLPFIGDLIGIALGFLKTNITLTAIWMLLGKMIRYAVWAYLTLWIAQ